MFCTGGIRCEKAGPFLEKEGFNVYQLEGGILKYFEECGATHYDGECFVFDKRVAVDPQLAETATQQCYACQHPLTVEEQETPTYVPGASCPYCYRAPEVEMVARIADRNQLISELTKPLPGSRPYDNHRPLNVPMRFDGQSVLQFLCRYHPHIDAAYWRGELEQGKIRYKDKPLDPNSVVWTGQRLVHLIAGTIEPEVNAEIRILYEDSSIVAVDKPAPLPMHPCGRFNRNSLVYILNAAYSGEKIRSVHRLDANTTGVVVVCRNRDAAQFLQKQFDAGTVFKTYIARVVGSPDQERFECLARISAEPAEYGVRTIDANGLSARTEFEVVKSLPDGTTILQCVPTSGRTNQIRLHLWHLGFPIVNDPIYLPNDWIGSTHTLSINDPAMCLHAWKIRFVHPQSREDVEFTANLPRWFA
jgi:RluA family pseudouridine synthase